MMFCVLLSLGSEAQNIEWAKSYGSKSSSEHIIKTWIESDSSSVFILTINLNTINPPVDTLFFDSLFFVFSSGINKPYNNVNSFFVRVNKQGKVITARHLGSFFLFNALKDSYGDYYFSARYNDTNSNRISGTSVKVLTSTSKHFYFKLDKDLNFKWVNQFGNISTIPADQARLYFHLTNDILYLTVKVKDLTTIGDSAYNFNNYTTVYGKISKTDGTIIWSKPLIPNKDFYIKSLIVLNKNMFIAGWNYSGSNIYISSDTIRQGESYILKLDSFGNHVKSLIFRNINSSKNYLCNISTDGENLFSGGGFEDSIRIGNQSISPNFPSGSDKQEMFVCAITQDLKVKWVYTPKILDLNSARGGQVEEITISKTFLYIGALLSAKSDFNLSILNPVTPAKYDLMVFKMDIIGNVLWAINSSSYGRVENIDALSGSNVSIVGTFSSDTIHFGKFILALNKSIPGASNDGFSVKLSDNAIIRGVVAPGPYCAGDTLRIPYRKIGDYDSSNYFIAELSDEHGNFNGAHRELGRIKTNRDSVVLGRLPLFQVSSSEKYRIRIISTAPAVQSYYKVDTLRLLIYSRDKADPGRDTLICKGDSLLLKTYGGTKWTWSPRYKMQDSTARETLAWPDVSTTYKIIIADSSGCGVADTAFKTVFVREALSVRMHTPADTTVCIGGQMPLIASFHGGDSLSYQWQWVSVDALNNYNFLKTGFGKLSDTLLYTMPAGEKDSMRFILYLYDGCTPKPAFYTHTLRVSKQPAQAVFALKDSALCPGTSLPLVVDFSGAPANKLSWVWQEAGSLNQWIQRRTGANKPSDTWHYTLPLSWKGIKTLRVVLSDACSGLTDTALYRITPRDTLRLSLNTGDTTLCHGQSYTWKASGFDGYPQGHRFVWTDANTGDTLSKADSLKLTAKNNLNIQVTLSDGCMPKPVSKSFSVTVLPELNSDILLGGNTAGDTVICFGQSIPYNASATGGKGSAYSYKWLLGGTQISTSNALLLNLSQYKTLAGSKVRLQLVVSDGCSLPDDSSEIEINILAPLSQTLQYPDSICFGSNALFKTSAAGGNGNYIYQWTDSLNATISTTDTLRYLHKSSFAGPLAYQVLVSDGCSFNDTMSVASELLAPLSITLSASDPCPVNALTLSATAIGGKTSSHLIRWFENGVLIGSGNSLAVNTFGLPKTYTAILSDGCTAPPDTQSIRTGAKPGIQIRASNACAGEATRLLAASTNAARAQSYLWHIEGLAQSSTDSLLVKTFAAAGYYKIKVLGLGSGTCNGSDSVNLEILDKPKAAFAYIHFNGHVPIPFQFRNRSLGSQAWFWDFGTGDTSMRKDPLYHYGDTGIFTVTLIASNKGRCLDTASERIPVYPSIEFYFPNVFSPNGNSQNESFGLHPGQWFMVQEYSLKIYNRWGEKVFESTRPQKHWTADKDQQGVYIWKAEIRDVYNVLREYKGVVEVLR